jgi:toxin-antitoxin system PIN domain toxin
MIVVDVNLLLYATFTGFPQHEKARVWWERELNATEDVGLCSPAVFGFLRIATNPRVLISPMPVGTATGYVRQWLGRPNVRFLVPGRHHIDIAFDLLQGVGTAGNLTTDVQLAAFALENDAEMFSIDSDFGRFPGLRWTNPLN